jgi:hypothetical protein
MSEVTLRWTQRVLGRRPGDVETVERTAMIDAVLKTGRAEEVKPAKKAAPAVKPDDKTAHEKLDDDGSPGTK